MTWWNSCSGLHNTDRLYVSALLFDRRWALPIQSNVSRFLRHASKEDDFFLSSKLGKLTVLERPAWNTHTPRVDSLFLLSITYIPSDEIDSATPELRSGWWGAISTTRKRKKKKKNTRSDKMHGGQGSIWLPVRRFGTLGRGVWCLRVYFGER